MAKIAVLHGNEGGYPTRPTTVPNYVSGGPVFTNRGSGVQEGGQYWFDNSSKMPFGKGMAMESSGSSPCAIVSETQIVVSGPFKHKIWVDRLDDSHRVLWSMGTNGREDGTQYLGIRGRPQGGGIFKLDLFGRDSGVGATLALSPSFTFPSNDGTPRLIVTERDSAGYMKLSLDGQLLVTSAAPWPVVITGYLAIFGLYDRVNSSAEGVYRESTGEMEFTVDEADLVYPFTVPTARFTVDTSDVTVGLTGAGVATGQASLAGDDAAALTGIDATTAPGTITQSRTRPLTNVLATSARGTVVAARSGAVTGTGATSEVGSVSAGADVLVELAGADMTAAPGAVVAEGSSEIVVALTGTGAAADAGAVGREVVVGMTGTGASADVGDASQGGSSTVLGQAAAAATGDLDDAHDAPLVGLGVSITAGAIGAPSIVAGLTGNSATATSGQVNAGSDVTIALSGTGASAAAGSLLGQADRMLTGEEVAAAFGVLGVDVVVALSGAGAVASTGTISTETPPTGWMFGTIGAESRQAVVGAETRSATIGAESRTWSITR